MTSLLDPLLWQLRRQRPDDRPDPELLARLARARDPEALEILVARYAPLVLGVCRRLLPERADVEDAFQATFLVLARRAPALRRGGSLGAWLHTVASRLALRARAARGRVRELGHEPPGGRDPLEEITGRELCAVLDEELQRLPERYRAPILLCCLGGKSREEAAHELGWSEGSVKARLQRGRERLRRRLERRGLLSTALLLPLLTQEAARASSLPLPPARALLAGAGAVLTPGAVRLAEEALVGLLRFSLRPFTALALLLALVVAGVRLTAGPQQPSTSEPSRAKGKPATGPGRPKAVLGRDALGDPLPDGALARLGSARLWHYAHSFPMSFSPDGKKLLTRGGDSCLREWELPNGRLLSSRWALNVQAGLPLTPDGQLSVQRVLVQAGYELIVTDVLTNKVVQRFPANDTISRPLLTADGKALVVHVQVRPRGVVIRAAGQKTEAPVTRIRVFDVVTRKQRKEFEAPAGARLSVISPDGKLLAFLARGKAPSKEDRLLVHDLGTGKERCALGPVPGEVGFSPDGQLLAVGHVPFPPGSVTSGGGLSIWDVRTGKRRHRLLADMPIGYRFAFSPDGKLLAAAAQASHPSKSDSSIRLFDMTTGRQLRCFAAHQRVSGPLVFSPDGKLLAAGSTRGPVRLFEVATGKAVGPAGRHLDVVAWCGFTPDGKGLLSLATNGELRLWDTASGRPLRSGQVGAEGGATGIASGLVTFAPDGRTLAAASERHFIHLHDLATLKPLRRWDALHGGNDSVSLAFTPDGETLTASFGFYALTAWDPATGKRLPNIGDRTDGQIHAFAYLPGGKQIAVLLSDWRARDFRRDGCVELWDAATGKVLWCSPTSGRRTSALAVSPCGRLIAAGGAAGVLDVYERITGRLFQSRRGPNRDGLTSVAFSPDGRLVAAVSLDRWLWVHDLAADRDVIRSQGHQIGMSSVAFAPDGKMLATASYDTTLLLWKVPPPKRDGQTARLTEEELRQCWESLAEKAEGEKVLRAVRMLADAEGQALALFRKRLAPPAHATSADIDQLIAGLDDQRFSVRRKAAAELEELGTFAEARLRKVLAGGPTIEKRRRVEELLRKLAPADEPTPHGRNLVACRAVWVVERVGTPEARSLLKEWCGRPGTDRLAAEATAALRRLARP
jgi:RNA polymerase sigma factor (sigma-70 family)